MLIHTLFFCFFFQRRSQLLTYKNNDHVFQQSGFASSSSSLWYMQFLLKIHVQRQIQQISISDILADLEFHLFECGHDSVWCIHYWTTEYKNLRFFPPITLSFKNKISVSSKNFTKAVKVSISGFEHVFHFLFCLQSNYVGVFCCNKKLDLKH